jgi:integrase
MPRKVRHAELDTRTARLKLKARGKPYWCPLDRGTHLGYRRLAGKAGSWVLRLYTGKAEGSPYETKVIGGADDLSDANGVDVLTFYQAQDKARALRDERSKTAAGIAGPYTVDDAMQEYLRFLEDKRKTADDASYRYDAFIKPTFGSTEIAHLKAKKIRDWHSDLAKLAPRLRTRKGEEQKFRKVGKDAENKRRRQASANRTLTVLKAALNMAWREGHVASNGEWSRVEPFENVDAARIRYLTVAEAKRLVNASEPDFRRLVQAALETGARYGELAHLTVSDFNEDNGTVAIRTSKTGKPRHIVLTAEGEAFFKQVCTGRPGNELMFVKDNGTRWEKSNQFRPMNQAVERAGIKPAINFHGLRHTWASLATMAGVPLLVVAKNLGHTDTRMVEKHYGHLCPDYIKQAIRENAPRFGFKVDSKVAAIR